MNVLQKYVKGDVVKHVKTGNFYIIEGYGLLESNLKSHVAYRSLSSDVLWFRDKEEMEQEERFTIVMESGSRNTVTNNKESN